MASWVLLLIALPMPGEAQVRQPSALAIIDSVLYAGRYLPVGTDRATLQLISGNEARVRCLGQIRYRARDRGRGRLRCEDGQQRVLSVRRHGDRSGTGRWAGEPDVRLVFGTRLPQVVAALDAPDDAELVVLGGRVALVPRGAGPNPGHSDRQAGVADEIWFE